MINQHDTAARLLFVTHERDQLLAAHTALTAELAGAYHEAARLQERLHLLEAVTGLDSTRLSAIRLLGEGLRDYQNGRA